MYEKNPKEPTKYLLKLVSEFSMFLRYPVINYISVSIIEELEIEKNLNVIYKA